MIKFLSILASLIIIYFLAELGLFWYKVKHLAVLPTIDQSDKIFGQGSVLKYIAAGDSTAVGAGASSLEQTYPYNVAQYLAKTHTVEYKNIAVIGFQTGDVVKDQLQKIVEYNPDVVTISIGANDATHLKSEKIILHNYGKIIQTLTEQTHAHIYITDIANFKTAKLLPWFYIKFLELRSGYINKKFMDLQTDRVTIINIHDFGQYALPNPGNITSADNFHPNDEGYKNWIGAFLEKIMKDSF